MNKLSSAPDFAWLKSWLHLFQELFWARVSAYKLRVSRTPKRLRTRGLDGSKDTEQMDRQYQRAHDDSAYLVFEDFLAKAWRLNITTVST